MPLGQTTRTNDNVTDLKAGTIVLITLDSGANWFRVSSWFSELNPSGGEAGETDYKYFEGETESIVDAPGTQQWEMRGRYSEGENDPFRNLYAQFHSNINDKKIGVRFFNSATTAGGFGWYVDGKLSFVSPPQAVNANSTDPNDFIARVQGTAVEYTIVAGDLLTPPSYA